MPTVQVSQANRAVEREVRGAADEAGAAPGGTAGVGVHEQLLAQPAVCEQFVALLCQFEPAAVLPFLQGHDSYRCCACLALSCCVSSCSKCSNGPALW